MEFKGTKETLMVSGGTEIVSMPSQIKVAKVGGLTYQEAVANATLFEHALEMLNLLVEIRDSIDYDEIQETSPYYLAKIEELTNRATTV